MAVISIVSPELRVPGIAHGHPYRRNRNESLHIDAHRRAAGWTDSASMLLPLVEGGRVCWRSSDRYPVISGWLAKPSHSPLSTPHVGGVSKWQGRVIPVGF